MISNTYLIDDDSNTLYFHHYFLNEYTYFNNVLEFQDARQAIDCLVADDSGRHNLVLLDLNMPIMSGWEFVDKVCSVLNSEQIDNTTIVVVSSSCNPRDISRVEAHPQIFSFIEKPFLPKEIEHLLETLSESIIHKNVA